MEKYPKELRFTQTHEWVRQEQDGSMVIGISEHAQSLLGEIVYVQLPDVDQDIHASDETAVVESVKAASDVYAPISGRVVAVNDALEEASSLINSDPYCDGWLFKIQPSDLEEYNALLTRDSYIALLEEQEA